NPLKSNSSRHLALLILARGGSKGIELKNIAKVGGVPLLKLSLEQIKKLNFVDSVWVSTNHVKIFEQAEIENVNIHWRSAESASDTATSLQGISEFLEHHLNVDIIGLIQCTSPFIKAEYIQAAINYMRFGSECVFSVTRSHKLIWREKNDKILPFNFDPKDRPRRQNWNGDLVENGMFYFMTRKLIHNGILQSRNDTDSDRVVDDEDREL
uniref:N-acylneuraminate cytidylyltransferase n=1 Tax=Diabrotica virgifera virgifera TaxID=50390 RepID=A0A6P7GTM2_DIAVI